MENTEALVAAIKDDMRTHYVYGEGVGGMLVDHIIDRDRPTPASQIRFDAPAPTDGYNPLAHVGMVEIAIAYAACIELVRGGRPAIFSHSSKHDDFILESVGTILTRVGVPNKVAVCSGHVEIKNGETCYINFALPFMWAPEKKITLALHNIGKPPPDSRIKPIVDDLVVRGVRFVAIAVGQAHYSFPTYTMQNEDAAVAPQDETAAVPVPMFSRMRLALENPAESS